MKSSKNGLQRQLNWQMMLSLQHQGFYCMRQRYRQNTPASTPEEYYRTTLVIPYIDELMLIAPLNDRFTGLTKVCSEGLYLIPHVITQSPDPFKLDEVMQFSKRYEVHLPSPRGLNIELELWEAKWRKAQHDGLVVPSTANESLKMCRKNDFPNIYTMLKILCTIGVTSCEDERANSELTWSRSLMLLRGNIHNVFNSNTC